MKIIKRSGAEASFDREKIITAVTKANPALRLINNGSTQTDVNIVLDILKKGS